MTHICEYGCGKEAKFSPGYRRRKWCCSSHYTNCYGFQKIRKKKLQKLWNDPKSKYNSVSRKQKLSQSIKRSWKDPNSGFNDPEVRKQIGENAKKKNCYSIKKLQRKYPFFCKVEKLRERNGKIEVQCKFNECKKWFHPKTDQMVARIGALERSDGNGGHYFYCSEDCKNKCPLYKLDPRIEILKDQSNPKIDKFNIPNWLRLRVLKRDSFKCIYCGSNDNLHIHHTKPQKIYPQLKYDIDYLITMCKSCHYKRGHSGECSTNKIAEYKCEE